MEESLLNKSKNATPVLLFVKFPKKSSLLFANNKNATLFPFEEVVLNINSRVNRRNAAVIVPRLTH